MPSNVPTPYGAKIPTKRLEKANVTSGVSLLPEKERKQGLPFNLTCQLPTNVPKPYERETLQSQTEVSNLDFRIELGLFVIE